jgi:hypothetical protein
VARGALRGPGHVRHRVPCRAGGGRGPAVLRAEAAQLPERPTRWHPERAARTEGKKADAPITARPAQAAPVHVRWARTLRPVLARSIWLTAGAGAGMLLALWVTQRPESARGAAAAGGGVGLAEAEELRQHPESEQAVAQEVLGLEMPKEPLPGQLRAPCKNDYEDELRGGCWVLLGKKKPPCGKNSYEWQGACYLASFPPKRPETSAKP